MGEGQPLNTARKPSDQPVGRSHYKSNNDTNRFHLVGAYKVLSDFFTCNFLFNLYNHPMNVERIKYSHSHTAFKWQNWDLNSGLSDSKAPVLCSWIIQNPHEKSVCLCCGIILFHQTVLGWDRENISVTRGIASSHRETCLSLPSKVPPHAWGSPIGLDPACFFPGSRGPLRILMDFCPRLLLTLSLLAAPWGALRVLRLIPQCKTPLWFQSLH